MVGGETPGVSRWPVCGTLTFRTVPGWAGGGRHCPAAGACASPQAGLGCSVGTGPHTPESLLNGSAWSSMGGQTSGPAEGLSPPPPQSWPSCPVSSCFVLGPAFFTPSHMCRSHADPCPFSRVKCLDVWRCPGGCWWSPGPLVVDLPRCLGPGAARVLTPPGGLAGPCQGHWGLGCCVPLAPGPSRPAAPVPWGSLTSSSGRL